MDEEGICGMVYRKSPRRGLFYGVPYHHIPLLEKDQYGMIQRLRFIIYHYSLHLWYKLVYIGDICGIRVLLEILSPCINETYDFFICFPFHSHSPWYRVTARGETVRELSPPRVSMAISRVGGSDEAQARHPSYPPGKLRLRRLP
jgi:hypothetical protein